MTEPCKRSPAQTSQPRLFIPEPVPEPLLVAARELRREMTDAEQFLWHRLRQKQLGGFRFRRQHPFQRYVLDFYCCEARLAIELDGGHHLQPDARARDAERTGFLRSHGIRVIRFWNSEVFTDSEAVLTAILQALQPPL
ncbi:MAG: endonuclease domain-containing protein, partial [Deltaproteobacteria bacterium]